MVQITLQELIEIAQEAQGQIDKIYLHWSACHYGSFFSDYHINIDADGSIHISTNDMTEKLAHTWRRNTGAIGIAMACCYNATSNDLGEEAPTAEQVESMAKVIAVLSYALQLEITPGNIMTHAEAADLDGYGPATTCERWDLAILQNGDEWMSGGNVLRGKAIWYQQNGISD